MELPQIQPFTIVIGAIFSIYIIVLLSTVNIEPLFNLIKIDESPQPELEKTNIEVNVSDTNVAPTKKIVKMKVNPKQNAKRKISEKLKKMQEDKKKNM